MNGDYGKFFQVHWVLDYPNSDYPNSQLSELLDKASFSAAEAKDVPVTGVLLQEKAKLLYERLFPNATTHFSSSMGFRSGFITSEPAERSRECCSTLYYSVAN